MPTRTALRDAATKVADNKARVDAMNDPLGVVEVAEGRGGTKRAHRPSCKRLPADTFETTGHTAVILHHAVPATCCKPRLPVVAAEEPEHGPDVPAEAKPARRTRTHPEYGAAMAAKKNGKRGAGARGDLTAAITEERRRYPDATRTEVMEVLYWVHGVAFSRPTFIKAWEDLG